MKIEKIIVGPIRTNCYILNSEKNNAILIDPGDEAGKIIEFLKEQKLDLKYILITHGHFDHVRALKELKNHYKEANVGFSEKDLNFLKYISVQLDFVKEHYEKEEVQMAREFLIESEENKIKYLKDDFIKLDDIYLQTIETPGHTKGGMTFLANDRYLFTGDTLFKNNIGGTDSYGGDLEVMKLSLKKLIKLDDNLVVYPGHGDKSTIGNEREWLTNFLK